MSDHTRVQGRRHLRLGWWSLALFTSLGVALELLHGFKLPLYLDVENETRRLMWTLSHAHGSLLSLMHIGFAYTLGQIEGGRPRAQAIASGCLTAATVLIPLGFFLGGVNIHGGDPGLGVALVAPGGLLLVASVVLTAREV